MHWWHQPLDLSNLSTTWQRKKLYSDSKSKSTKAGDLIYLFLWQWANLGVITDANLNSQNDIAIMKTAGPSYQKLSECSTPA